MLFDKIFLAILMKEVSLLTLNHSLAGRNRITLDQ